MTGLSETSEKVRIVDYMKVLEPYQSVAVFVGAFASGKDDLTEVDDSVAISEYALTAGACCSKVTCAFEDLWNIA